jgi:hypothetical protein
VTWPHQKLRLVRIKRASSQDLISSNLLKNTRDGPSQNFPPREDKKRFKREERGEVTKIARITPAINITTVYGN